MNGRNLKRGREDEEGEGKVGFLGYFFDHINNCLAGWSDETSSKVAHCFAYSLIGVRHLGNWTYFFPEKWHVAIGHIHTNDWATLVDITL